MHRLRPLLLVLIAAFATTFWACNAAHLGQRNPGPDDTVIMNAVQSKLFEDPALKVREIHVTSQNGVVTLTGAVNSNIERLAVERLANQASGVTQVIDQIVVSAPPMAQAPSTGRPSSKSSLPGVESGARGGRRRPPRTRSPIRRRLPVTQPLLELVLPPQRLPSRRRLCVSHLRPLLRP